MKILSFTCTRNEGPYLLEWIAYHRLIGVGDFLFFTNDCEDGTDRMLDALAAQGVVRHVAQSAGAGKSVQWQALQTVARDKATEGFDWAMFTDVDEFPMVHIGAHRLADAIAALPDNADAVAMPWRLFGSGGQARFRGLPVTAQFTRSAPPDLYHPIAGRYFKTLYRPDRFRKPGVHRPKRLPGKVPPQWFDGSGHPLPEAFATREAQIALPGLTPGRAIIDLHHYSVRSAESFLVKSARGLANRQGKSIDLSYWVERNFNTVENRAMAVWGPALETEIAALRALPGIADLHARACDWHRARFADLLRTQAGYRLYADCLHVSDSAALPREVALNLYAAFARIAK